MAWNNNGIGKGENGLAVFTETITGPNSATVYSSLIDGLRPNFQVNNRWITVAAVKSASAVGTITIQLYGSFTRTGTKVLLKTDVITSLTNAVKTGLLDLNAFPAPYYYIAVLSNGNDSNGTVAITVCG
jgi:hypothetical protein